MGRKRKGFRETIITRVHPELKKLLEEIKIKTGKSISEINEDVIGFYAENTKQYWKMKAKMALREYNYCIQRMQDIEETPENYEALKQKIISEHKKS